MEVEPVSFQELQVESILHWPGKPVRNDPAGPEEHIKVHKNNTEKSPNSIIRSYHTIQAHCTTATAASEIISTKWDLPRGNPTIFPVPEHKSN